MCSILGGTEFNNYAFELYNRAKDRGRDFSGLVQRNELWLCNHRATPTNEIDKKIENQPFGKDIKIIHNGTIANDKELGNTEDNIDSQVLEKIINGESLRSFRDSLYQIKGSYAIAILKENTIFLACNYKPIWYVEKDGQQYFSSLKNHLIHIGTPTRMEPYSVMNLLTKEILFIKREQPNRALIVCSGGLDSTSIIGYAKKTHDKIHLLHFDYSCKATKKEIEAIKKIAREESCSYEIIKIDYSKFKGESTLFKEEEITTGKEGVEYAIDWVYARNLILLSTAVGYAEANKYGYIYLGTNLEEAGAYPDNEEQFILDFNNLLYGAVNNGFKVEIKTPLGGLMKKEIVEFGIEHDSPIHLSWSCYNGGEIHCGKCAPCYMRKKAFNRSGVIDSTKYENEKQNNG